LVAVDRIRWFDGVEFDMDYCPTLESTWRSMIGDLRPTLVLEIASVPEQSEQMYEGDATWYTVDDPEFVARHDAVMTELVTLVGSVGGRLVLFDSPAVFGEGLGKAPFAQPDRIAAWNAMLAGWAARWPDIEVLEWSKIVDLVEEIPGELRTDDVHMEQDVLDDVVREHVVPLLDGFVSGGGSDPLGPTGP
jgi:hypothetical protein